MLNRRATYRLAEDSKEERRIDRLKAHLKERISNSEGEGEKGIVGSLFTRSQDRPDLQRSNTITSTLSDSRYAVLPHGETLEGWTHEDKLELDDLVRHMLHSRRARFKRSMKGFLKYVQRREYFLYLLHVAEY